MQTTALEFLRNKLRLGATLLMTQNGWTSTSETKGQALLRILPASRSAFCQYKSFLHISPAHASRPPLSLHLWAYPELYPTCNRLCLLLLEVCPEFCFGMRTGFGPRIISDDQESPYTEDFMGPPANLQLEPGRYSREPPSGYQRWTKVGSCRLSSQNLHQGA